jgi:four helix bundle protein
MEFRPMGVNSFEDLRVWQAAKGFSDAIGALIRRQPLQGDFALRDQLNAATLSIVANIAEGFARGGRKEFHYFVRIAAASNAEARALLHAAHGRGYFGTQEYQELLERSNSIGRMLRVLGQKLR